MNNSLIVAVFRSGKIPEALYTTYKQQCERMAAEILEGTCAACFLFVNVPSLTIGLFSRL